MRLVTSETSMLHTDGETRLAPSPMHALRPLLRAIADECHAGGSGVTERILGDHRAVLSVYEPLLAQVPSAEPLTMPAILSPDAGRKRLFHALTEVLQRFASERPVLFVIDDLGWVDEVSLAFLTALSAAILAQFPVFWLCTYRSEDTPDAVSALARLPHVTHVQLQRLGEQPVRSMVSDMLAQPDPAPNFVEFVTREAEGNPFFVAEYLRAAVSERVLYRDQVRTWQVRGRSGAPDETPMTLALPRSLKALIDQRLRSLSTAGQQLSLAAAVLGREMDFAVLREVSAMPDQTFVSAVDELLRRQVLEQPEPGQLRFAHDKLREVTHQGAQPSAIRQLHARAATALERSLPGESIPASYWAVLGHHYGEAELRPPALRYLTLAAEHARESSAHGEASSLYRQAIQHAKLLESDEPESYRERTAALYEAYGDLLLVLGEMPDARCAYDAAFSRSLGKPLLRSRLYRKIGKTWEAEHKHAEAIEQFARARDLLTLDRESETQERRDEWIQLRLDELWSYYWTADIQRMNELSAELSPYMHQASPPQRARYFGAQMKRNLRRDRYTIREETRDFAQLYLEACLQGNLVDDLPIAHFNYGFTLLLMGAVPEAEQQFELANAQFLKAGDTKEQARCDIYMALCARRADRLEDTAALVARSVLSSRAVDAPVYVAAALGNQAWVHLRRGERALAIEDARAALAIWDEVSLAFPFEWIARVPLLRASLLDGDTQLAMESAAPLLDAGQQQLPEPANATLEEALRKYQAGHFADTRVLLERVLEQLPAGYC